MRRNGKKQKVVMLAGVCTGAIVLGITAISMWNHQKNLMVTEDCFAYTRMQSLEGTDLYELMMTTVAENKPTDRIQEAAPSAYDGRFIANIKDTLNIRLEPSTESDIVGKLYPGCVGDILADCGEWIQVRSGKVEGYVKKEYVLSGRDAEPLAEEYGKYIGTVTGDTLRIRQEASVDSAAIGLLAKEQKIYVTETLEGWYGIETEDGIKGYVSSEFLEVEFRLETAITIEEEQERIAEAKRLAEEEEARRVAANTPSAPSAPAVTPQAPIAANYDEAYLLACLVSMEAGHEPYEGQLAVANVVLNRLRSGRYGSTIQDVIYAPGQFPSVGGSVMTGYLNNGPLASAQQAANEALAGNNNIGGYMSFRNVKYANYAAYSSYVVIGNHCFF